MGVQEDLHALVFGESVLNDAVAISLFRTLMSFEKAPATAGSIAKGAGLFAATFLGSMLIGIGIGVLSALLFKHVKMRRQRTGLEAEKSLLTVTPLVAYMLSEGLQLSGVVAILFCGVTMGRYAFHNVSSSSRNFVHQLYRMASGLCECLAFIYIGLALPKLGSDGMKRGWPIALLVLVFCLLARGVSTAACTWIVNKLRVPAERVSRPARLAIWMAGLRGGVAFALATAAAKAISDS